MREFFDIFHYLVANNLDIISLQEVFYRQSDSKAVPKALQALEGAFPGERARLVLVRLLTLAGYHVISNAGKNQLINGKLENSGLLIASKFPVKDIEYLSYTFDGKMHSNMSDRLADKGILKVKLQYEQRTVSVFNTHTQASIWEWDLHNKTIKQAIKMEESNINTRISQYKFLEKIMTQDKDYNLLIASGDFNLSNKVLSKAKDTLVYDKDPENREVKNFEEIFSEYLHHNPLQEDTWIPEYYESDGRVSTRNFRLQGVVRLRRSRNSTALYYIC